MTYYITCDTPHMPIKTKVDVPALIKGLRKSKAITQEKLAQKLGVSFSSVNSWENGKRMPHPFLLKRLRELAAFPETRVHTAVHGKGLKEFVRKGTLRK